MDSLLDPAEMRKGLIFYIVLLVSLCIHEWAHAWTADKLGDDTPAMQGRVTLDPRAHMDLYGSVIFPLVCIFFLRGSLLFGWGKPVAINPSNFARRGRDEVLTTLAGPASNLVLALIGAVAAGYCVRMDSKAAEIFLQLVMVNVWLAVFNLLPIPPLDGGTVLRYAVGMTEETFHAISRWSFLLLLIVFYFPPLRDLFGEASGIVSVPFDMIYRSVAG